MTIFDQKFTTEKEDTTSPEHYLWISVLTKAAHDALYSSDWFESKKAIEWFKRKGSNFYKVCEYAGKSPEYVYQKMIEQIKKRESHMESVRNGNRLYVKDNERFHFHSHYRGGRLGRKRGTYNVKKKHLTGNAYYKAKRQKDPLAVMRGRKGGRPRLYLV